MIKKIPLVLIALFFGFFLLNCSDSSFNDPNSSSSSSLQADVPSSSSIDAPSSSSSQADTPSSSSGDASSSSSLGGTTLKAEPSVASDNPSSPKIVASWTNGGKNYYVIDAGVIRKIFISAIFGPEHYDGYHQVPVTTKTINTSTVTTSTTETVSKSIAISNTLGVKLGLEEAIKAGIPGIGDLSVKLNLEVSETVNVSNGKTTSTSVTDITTYVQSQEDTRSMTFGSNGAPAGYYRYGLYGVSDVYFVIVTSSDNQTLLSWDVVSCVRPGDYLRHNDYSPDGDFDNSPSIENQIIFAEGFYKTLPKPAPPPPPKTEKTETKEFTIPNTTDTYIFDKSFPATIEIYAVGGGGGGQGGNSWEWFGTRWGTGGGGGGGATAYIKIDVNERITFGIKVGEGGYGGARRHYNNSTENPGYPGDNGGETTVSWSAYTLTVAGGTGGGTSGKNGGSGAGAPKIPSISYLDWGSANGGTGTSGEKGGQNGPSNNSPAGGSAGKLSKGYLGTFPSSSVGNGGNGGGGNNSDGAWSGAQGNSGQVKIVVKYHE